MSIDEKLSSGHVPLQITAGIKVSARFRNWGSSSHPPALSRTISKKFEVSKVTVNGFDYSEVSTAGALTDGTYFIDRSGNDINELFVEARNIQDSLTNIQSFTDTPDDSELVVGTLGEAIPGDASTYAEFVGPWGLSASRPLDELSDQERNWLIYTSLQYFYYYAVENSLNVYGYYEPYFLYTDISGMRSFINGYAQEYEPGPYFNYTDWSSMSDDYDGVSMVSQGAVGWVLVIKYVDGVSGGSSVVNMAAKKENYLTGGNRNFDDFNVSGSTVDDLYNDVVRVEFGMNIAKHWDITNDQIEEERLINVPRVEKRIEPLFGKPIHRGAGTLVLANSDGFFDDLRTYDWAGNTCVITVKSKDYDSDTWTDSQEIGRFLMTDVTFTRDQVNVRVEEITKFFETGFPLRLFDDLESINSYEENEGHHVPYIYGQCFAVKAFLVKKSSKEFQVADHRIYSVSNIRREVNGEWVTTELAGKDYEAGRFRLKEWEEGQAVICDCAGYVGDDGRLMNNPGDIASHILNLVDFAVVNTAAITEARNYYDVADGFPFRVVDKEVGLYIREPGKVGDVFEKMNRACFSFFRFNNSHEIEFKAWFPKPKTDITVEIQDYELHEFSEINTEKDLVTEIHAHYQVGEEEDEKATYKHVTDGKDRFALGGERVKEYKTMQASRKRAKNWAEKLASIQGSPQKTYKIRLKSRPITWLAGDQIRLKINRWGYDSIVEIISISNDLMTQMCEVVFSDRRSWNLSSGWWALDSADTYSLLDAAEVKQEQWETDGYWTDINGFLNDQDQTSYKISRWI